MAKREQTTKAGAAAAAAAEGQTFEAQLAALERVVRELERGDLPLERSLELFEQGVRLSRVCQERLNEAERRIEVLLRDGEGRATVGSLDEAGFGRLDPVADEEDDDESVF
ncbi:MAG TPA: exodeoxyribonuclease VII small subunit [Pyrinomonadaceae bacterium]